jgi:hypothetical protein
MSLRQVADGGLFFNSVKSMESPHHITPLISNLTGSELNNYEKFFSGLLRISKVYVTSKKSILIISLVVMPES